MAAATDSHDDLTDKSWKSQAWLDTFPLDARTAISYFAESIFYDPACNNEIARKQFMDPNQITGLPPGVEYVVTHAQEPHLFVICKQERSASREASPQAYYYILDGAIYQAPTLHQILSSRMDRCKWNMRAAFAKLKSHLDPLTRVSDDKEEGKKGSDEGPVVRPRALSLEQREHAGKVDNILLTVLRKYPLPEPPAAETTAQAVMAVKAESATPSVDATASNSEVTQKRATEGPDGDSQAAKRAKV
mmetsp:Transcript_37631/g.106315  ORF Transcript_37631/g.106315 Transcript_37631/m.106315 type:complete len:247 (-) Transcript_37631:264-1004(-)|eukprot:CAMPEP_0117650508 /NCGR_PEP_ID=MMETSP0804-20121206/1576_1 /TAXON_ID=1074897 /ORGANISM="Tetraselmis astigmatica, Strain CCMP880" /LENGTH=246 /DNA_ID=CAMNT_0005456383 /DNA_START=398 /DNA_END=1138 /DNA_ORIENTATION=-